MPRACWNTSTATRSARRSMAAPARSIAASWPKSPSACRGRGDDCQIMKGRAYRRKSIAIAGEFETVAAMEDDFHHFTVRLRHDGERVTGISGETIRFPWSVCPGAAIKLDE